MITRREMYQDASELLKLVSMYPGMTEWQASGFFPGKEEKVPVMLEHLSRQKRVRENAAGGWISWEGPEETDTALLKAVWVLLDFRDELEYHSAGEYPVQILFFARGEVYEIIMVQAGQETLMNRLFSDREKEQKESCRRILLVDDPAQIELLNIPGAVGYCTVDGEQVTYYQDAEEGE